MVNCDRDIAGQLIKTCIMAISLRGCECFAFESESESKSSKCGLEYYVTAGNRGGGSQVLIGLN